MLSVASKYVPVRCSSLLMLVCAFGGTRRVMTAYRQAVDRKYRFFSYGDAMLLTPSVDAARLVAG